MRQYNNFMVWFFLFLFFLPFHSGCLIGGGTNRRVPKKERVDMWDPAFRYADTDTTSEHTDRKEKSDGPLASESLFPQESSSVDAGSGKEPQLPETTPEATQLKERLSTDTVVFKETQLREHQRENKETVSQKEHLTNKEVISTPEVKPTIESFHEKEVIKEQTASENQPTHNQHSVKFPFQVDGCEFRNDYYHRGKQPIASDKNGNFFLACIIDKDFNLGDELITSSGGKHLFLAKISSKGTVLWTKKMSMLAKASTMSFGLETDGLGNLLLYGGFNHYPSMLVIGNQTLQSKGNVDSFVIKFDKHGKYVWKQHFGGKNSNFMELILRSDKKGNSYLVARYATQQKNGTLQFGKHTLSSPLPQNYHPLVAKLNSQGKVVWYNAYEASNYLGGLHLAINQNSHLYVSARYSYAAFNRKFYSKGGTDSVILKFSTSGKLVQHHSFATSGDDSIRAIAVDSKEAIYVAGVFSGNSNIQGKYFRSKGLDDVYILKLSSLGKNPEWTRTFGGNQKEYVEELLVGPNDEILLKGSFGIYAKKGIVYPQYMKVGVTTLSKTENECNYLALLSTKGEYLWAKSMDIKGSDHGFGFRFLSKQKVLITNIFSGEIKFDNQTFQAQNQLKRLFLKLTLTPTNNNNGTNGNNGNNGNTNSNQPLTYTSPNRLVPEAIVSDNQGNRYIAGTFSNSLSFSDKTLTNSGDESFYVAKIDKHGKTSWTQKINSHRLSTVDIAVDKNQHLYLIGTFGDECCWSTSLQIGSMTLKTMSAKDVFIAKFDKQGKVVWAKSFGTPNDSSYFSQNAGFHIQAGASGNLYISGMLGMKIKLGKYTLESKKGSFFLAKMTANGDFAWAKNYHFRIKTLALDPKENVYAGGFLQTSVKFGGKVHSTRGETDVLISKWNKDGKELWATAFGSSNDDIIEKIVVNTNEEVYFAGSFDVSTKIGAYTFTAYNNTDAGFFVGKIGSSGSIQWAKGYDVYVFEDTGTKLSMALNSQGDVFVSGTFGSLFPGFGSSRIRLGGKTLTSKGESDIFILKLTSNGQVKEVNHFGGKSNESSGVLTTTPQGQVLLHGATEGNLSVGTFSIGSTSNKSAFILTF